VLEAAARAQALTGRTLLIHPGRHPDAPLAALRAAEAGGADLGRVVMSHLDRTIDDVDRIAELAHTGAFVAFDLFGHETSYYVYSRFLLPNDAVRLRMVKELFERGYSTQVVIAQDICNKTHLSMYGGEGYGHILRRVVPIMEQLGMLADVQRQLLVTNPARALTGLEAGDLE
jgi:phosphotriesterase-related protein